MNESRLQERQPRSVTERQGSMHRPQQSDIAILGWVAVAVAAYAAYRTLPSLVRYLRIERM